MELVIDDRRIYFTDAYKLLGVIIDKDLNFSQHISEVCITTSKMIGVLQRLKNLIPMNAKLRIYKTNLVPRVFHLPTPRGAREERPWFRLVTCLGNKFIFEGGVPIYQSIVAAAVCYHLNRLSGQPWIALFRFRSEDLSYQVHCFQHLKLNWVWEL